MTIECSSIVCVLVKQVKILGRSNHMGIGIQICGLNGCGKSTLGRALAEKIGFHFIDN